MSELTGLTGWQKAIVRMVAMLCIMGIVAIAAFVFKYDGLVLLIGSLLIVGLGNIKILRLILPYVEKVIPKKK